MALIKPTIDLENGVLNVTYPGLDSTINIPLSPTDNDTLQSSSSRVCGDKITALTYSAPEIVDFFSNAIGVPCTLARFPASLASQRHFKPHLQNEDAGLDTLSCTLKKPQILLSNESPILVINRASVDHVNELIAGVGGKTASADVYRANLVISQINGRTSGSLAYSEDGWKRLQIGRETFEVWFFFSHLFFYLLRRHFITLLNFFLTVFVMYSYLDRVDVATWSVLTKLPLRRMRSRM